MDDWQVRYNALSGRVEALELENRTLRAQIVISDGRDRAHEVNRAGQAEIVQREIARLNEQLQTERAEIDRLRQMLRESDRAN